MSGFVSSFATFFGNFVQQRGGAKGFALNPKPESLPKGLEKVSRSQVPKVRKKVSTTSLAPYRGHSGPSGPKSKKSRKKVPGASRPRAQKTVEKKSPKGQKRGKNYLFRPFFQPFFSDFFQPFLTLEISSFRLKFSISLETSISLENFNLDLDNSHKIGVWWVVRLKFSISLENVIEIFNLA